MSKNRLFITVEEKMKFLHWLNTLSVGQEVSVVMDLDILKNDKKTIPLKVLTVEKVLPTGKFKLSDGSLWSTGGSPASPDAKGLIYKTWPSHKEIQLKIKNAVNKNLTSEEFYKFSTSLLREIKLEF